MQSLGKVIKNDRVTPEKAAEHLGVKPATLAKWRSTKRYQIPYIKVGRLVMYRLSDLDSWLESQRIAN